MPKEILHLTAQHTSENGICLAIRNLSANYPLHWHDYYEIEYVTSGSGKCLINDVEFDFKVGDLLFLTPSDFEEVLLEPNTNATFINISFDNNWINNDIYGNLSEGIVIPDYPAKFIECINSEYDNNDVHNALYIRYMLNCVLIDIIRKSTDINNNVSTSKYSEYVHKALKYTHAHFREQISQADVADNIGLSRNYFCSKFHSEVGMTFKQFLTELRLKYSVSLFINSDLSITDVCMLSGFNDFSNYFHIFKKRYTLSPLQYRKAHTKSDKINFESIEQTYHTRDTKSDSSRILKINK